MSKRQTSSYLPTTSMDGRSSVYDVVSYQGGVVPNSSSNHLALCSLWRHGPHPLTQRFHLTELGCGDGANLLPLAFYNRESTFIGIDNSGAAIHRAEAGARCLGLENIHFVQDDVRTLEPADLRSSDYIITHGLYSWVPEEARAAMLSFCRNDLTPSGLAYISYNAQPGWSMRSLVRETLLRAQTVREAAVEDKAARAVEVATQLLEDLPSQDYAFGALLAEELARVRNGNPGYVFHEYLAEHNEGFWLRDFIAHAQQHGLDYVADAQDCRWEGQIPQALRASLSDRDLDPIEQEEMTDLLCHRSFRASILCRSDAPRQSTTHREILETAFITTSLCADSDPFDLTEGVVETFCREHGPEITLDVSITKAAIVLLANQWPQGMRFESLWQRASQFLVSYGCAVHSGAREQLLEELILLYERGQLDLRLDEPNYGRDVPEYPQAHALARFEARHREALTTPFHLPIRFEPEALQFVQELDGSRSTNELHRVFSSKIIDATLPVLARWGLLCERGGE